MSYRAIAVEGNRQPVDFKDGQNFGEGQPLVRFIFHSRIGRDPIYFPSLPSIIRECLLKTA
jgi:hypothetical protein